MGKRLGTLLIVVMCTLGFSLASIDAQKNKPLVAKVVGKTVVTTWNWSDPNYPTATYNLYRFNGVCPAPPATAPGTFTKINVSAITTKTYSDAALSPGTYCYFVTANNATAQPTESVPSNLVTAVILQPGIQPPVLDNPTQQ